MNTISFRFDRYKGAGELNDNNTNNFSKAAERRSCWSVLSIDGLRIEAKIIHKGRGKFKILEDIYRGKYIGKIVDASDVIRCKL
ncbi:MAG: hypothetical protein M3Y53_01790 [Thermoproteota archaeon]|nr:hypothetical protein [Thermoproteota archaeon]